MKRIIGRMFLMGLAALAGIAVQDCWTEAAHAALAVNDSVLVKLPAPDTMGGKTLRECLDLRRANRNFNQQRAGHADHGQSFLGGLGNQP